MLDARAALSERLARPGQVTSEESIGRLPPYADAFLSHLRLLVGVPFTYLVPHENLLPDGAIRFFYIDRSWTDRLVDGAIAVGKLGSREVEHYGMHAHALAQAIDAGERIVRAAQRRKVTDWMTEKEGLAVAVAEAEAGGRDRAVLEAGPITGFLLRSALVSGWPHMEVRAYRDGAQLELARLERLSQGVMIALFFGVPDRVELEEPHHGVQFGVAPMDTGGWGVYLRDPEGNRVEKDGPLLPPVPVPLRTGNRGVVHIRALRARMDAEQKKPGSEAMPQAGSAAFALSVLDPPFRQPFAGNGDEGSGGKRPITMRTADTALHERLERWVKNGRD